MAKANLHSLNEHLNALYRIQELDRDPAMSRFLPAVYDEIGFNWRGFFEPEFVQRFNGLMIKGDEHVETVFCSAFPTPEVIQSFLSQAHSGDVLFLHHPIDLECGSPKGAIGRGFLPISSSSLLAIKAKGLSIFACHAPMDCHEEIGTNAAIVSALKATVREMFEPYGIGFAGRICEIGPVATTALIERLKQIFDVPYVAFAGKEVEGIEKLAIVAGGGDDVDAMQEAQSRGAQAYLTGEIHSHGSGEWSQKNTEKLNEFADSTHMSLIGVSHSASEFLTMKSQMAAYFEKTFGIRAEAIPQSVWWR